MFTEEQLAIRDTTRRFIRQQVVPHAMDWDAAREVPQHVWHEIGALGLYSICAPASIGGSDGDFVSWALAVEEMAYGDCAIANAVGGCSFPFLDAMVKYGTPAQIEEYARPVAAGEYNISLLLSEPHAGSDLSKVATRAVRRGDRWVVNGHKVFISHGATSGCGILLASTDPEAGKKGMTCFLVRPTMKGYNVLRRERKLGHRATDLCQIALDDLELGDEHVLGPIGGGYRIILEGLDSSRVGVAAQCVGVAQAAYDAALVYAKDRTAFGKPIFEHQAVGFKLVEMATKIEAARHMVLHAARLKAQDARCVREASMAKLFASEMVEWVCSAAVQIFGGAGYLEGSIVEKLYRDQRILQIYEGTNEVHKMLIQRELAPSV